MMGWVQAVELARDKLALHHHLAHQLRLPLQPVVFLFSLPLQPVAFLLELIV